MTDSLSIHSIRDNPTHSERLKSYAASHWPPISHVFSETIDQCLATVNTFPQCYYIMDNDKIIGFYQLLENELIERTDLSPWISCVFIDENRRGERLIEQLLLHGRITAGLLGFNNVYLTTDHIHLYEKFGFREIGIDRFVWGRPTKIYEHCTIKSSIFK